jgi:predicted O-methyltransferase YrrM
MNPMDIPGWTSEEENEWLKNQASRMNFVVEIGCWLGRTAASLATDCKGTVFTVDTFRGSPSEVETNHREAAEYDMHEAASKNLIGYPNISIMRMTSLQASRMFQDKSIDMVFIDGEHTRESVIMDLLAWKPKVRHLLCGHDADIEGVYQALEIFEIPWRLGPGSIWYMEF